MKYTLIDQTEIDALPEGNAAAFVEFERICRQRLGEILETFNQNDDWNGPRLRYMGNVAAAAEAYNIDGFENLPTPNPHNFQFENFIVFEHEITQIVTKLQIKNAKQKQADTVKLPASRAAQISKYVEILRRRIEASDFDDKKKSALFKKLDALRAELTGKRADLSKTMIIIASIVTTVNQAEAAIIKLPAAITAVMQVIGFAKDDEEAEKAAIAAASAPKAIEDQRPKTNQSKIPRGSFSSHLDDEIPF
jgi:hypothetical protein